jgi:predicted N-formylglutamate amidohydrolase
MLEADEPAPVEVVGGGGRSPFLLVCDHAGRLLPRALGTLGLSPQALQSHIAWDIGAAGVARRLSALLDAELVLQRYSRLAIDCNRPLSAADSIAEQSGGVAIAGNRGLTREQAAARANALFEPYHAQVRGLLDARAARQEPAWLVSVHSFTPELLGAVRPWHTGVLYHRDTRLARPMLELLRLEAELVVGDNEPYAASELGDFSIIEHGERRGLPYVELEIRQDLIGDEDGQAAWAARFARLLTIASGTFHAG